MSYANLPPTVKAIAEAVLTDKQLEAWQLELAGQGIRPIAWRMKVTPRVIADRLVRVHQLLLEHDVRQDEYGRWHLDTTEAA